MKPTMGRGVFDDSDSDGENPTKSTEFEINHEYARRFEHNKKREDLQRFEELKKKGLAHESDDSESEEEYEDEDLVVSREDDLKYYDFLLKIKNKDPIIYQKDVKFFDSDDEEEKEDDNKVSRGKKEKPLYLKDVIAKQLLEDGPEFAEESGPKNMRESQSKIYSKEQEENLRAFQEAAGGTMNDSDNELFQKKERVGKEGSEDEEDLEVKKKINELWGEDDEGGLFLKNLMANKPWLGKNAGKESALTAEDLEEISDDEEILEKQEKYEAEYNFRHEEEAGDRIIGHARATEGSVRKKTTARKRQRDNKKERMAQAELERKEELKHLKNLKKKEMKEKLEKIRAIAGIGDETSCKLNKKDLEEDFDPEEYDKKMNDMFGVDYYDDEDVDPGFGSNSDDDLDKPDFDKEDELLGLPKDWDVVGGEGFKAARERSLQKKKKDEESFEEIPRCDSKKDKKIKMSLQEKVDLEKELEEYYKLDYEDTIGDLRTRFKYKYVPSNTFGLSATEILKTEDKELNQYVSLKKIAPYVEEEWKVPRVKRHQMKAKIGGGEKNDGDKYNKKQRSKDHVSTESENPEDETTGAAAPEEDGPSKRSKRRRKHAELKISQSRLAAYGKIPTVPNKKKQKH